MKTPLWNPEGKNHETNCDKTERSYIKAHFHKRKLT